MCDMWEVVGSHMRSIEDLRPPRFRKYAEMYVYVGTFAYVRFLDDTQVPAGVALTLQDCV